MTRRSPAVRLAIALAASLLVTAALAAALFWPRRETTPVRSAEFHLDGVLANGPAASGQAPTH